MTAILRSLVLLILGSGSGCVEEGLVLCVGSLDAEDSDQIDLVVTMSEDADFETVCRPVTIQIRGSDLEYCVAIAPGPRYAAKAFLRAEQRRQEGGNPVAVREFEADFVDGEQEEHDVFLSTLCPEPCGAGQQCLGEDCVSLLYPDGLAFEGTDDCDTSP